jgi:5S rRNA maturation endonuclease (ribonuclease M5)
LNRIERFNLVARALIEARASNLEGSPVLVEGQKDVIALEALGFKGPIEILNRGWPVDRVAVWIVENYSVPTIVLMDWDRTGGRLQRKLADAFESLDYKILTDFRKTLSKAMRPETLCLEDLKAFADELLELIELIDPQANARPSP